ncbi:MAG TPA: hypothetical protein VMX18_00250 [Candidatus Bipolaricaulota bacterium]|nr:hypothetical protein [Candidatus Bipolaricaulota bacterium]
MKIVSQDSNAMVIKDQNVAGYFGGLLLTLIGFIIFINSDFGYTSLIALAFIIVGVLLVIFIKTTTIQISKGEQKIMLFHKSMLKKTDRILSFADVKAVTLQPMSRIVNGQRQNYYDLYLTTNSNEQIKLNPGQMKKGFQTGGKSRQLASQMAEFMGKPLNESALPNMGEIFSTIKGAIAENKAQKENDNNQPQK